MCWISNWYCIFQTSLTSPLSTIWSGMSAPHLTGIFISTWKVCILCSHTNYALSGRELRLKCWSSAQWETLFRIILSFPGLDPKQLLMSWSAHLYISNSQIWGIIWLLQLSRIRTRNSWGETSKPFFIFTFQLENLITLEKFYHFAEAGISVWNKIFFSPCWCWFQKYLNRKNFDLMIWTWGMELLTY